MRVFPVDRYLRAARRNADVSQRELARRAGLPHQVVAKIERQPALARVRDLAMLLEAAGLHLAVLDDDGLEVAPEPEARSRLKDRGARRFPAHLDVRPGSDGWWGDGWPMFFGRTPDYTFDRSRGLRDWRRGRLDEGRPDEEGMRRGKPDPTAGDDGLRDGRPGRSTCE
jgi:transcriptional regulator with XRE-family HTH domain